jgi:hypothetical protein
MLEKELKLNNWRDVLDSRVRALLRSIEIERARLEKIGASEEQIADALSHQLEILGSIYSEDYPILQREGELISFRGAPAATKVEKRNIALRPRFDLVLC